MTIASADDLTTRTYQIRDNADGTLLIDLNPAYGMTVEQLLELKEDLNDYILEVPYAAGYRL